MIPRLSLEDICKVTNYDKNDKSGAVGVVEFIVTDRNGNLIQHIVEKNVVKIFAKEMLSHRLPSSEVWSTTGSTGGTWVPTNNDLTEEFAVRYMLFGASYDSNGTPLGTNDPRYYTTDTVTGATIPIRLTPAADFDGGLINGIPITEPTIPLKRIENVTYKNTYQPTSSPLVDSSVRAMNNIVVFETTLQPDEYNGFGTSSGNDFFTITEVALAGGRRFTSVPVCGLTPTDLFLHGNAGGSSGFEIAQTCTANGTNVISIDPSDTNVNLVKVGDQIKIVNVGGTQHSYSTLNQINPHYLVVGKLPGGRDIELDRVPVDDNGAALTGQIGIFKDTLRLFSQRIVSTPIRKSSSFSILCRWNIIYS